MLEESEDVEFGRSTRQGWSPAPAGEILQARQKLLASGKPAAPPVDATPAVVDVHPAHGRIDLESGQAFAYIPAPASGERKDFFRLAYVHDGRNYTITVNVQVKDCGAIQGWKSEVGSADEICKAGV